MRHCLASVSAAAAFWLQRYTTFILLAGVIINGWVMFDKHRLDQSARTDDVWLSNVLYWICWGMLAVLLFWTYVHHYS